MKTRALLSSSAIALLFITLGCEKKIEGKIGPSGPPPTLVTATRAQPRVLEVLEETVGTLENLADPKIGAEIAGRVMQVAAVAGQKVKKGDLLAVIQDTDFRIQQKGDQADIARLQTLLAQQERLVERQGELVKQNFLSKNALDDAMAQRDAIKAQITSARAKAETSSANIGKARVLAPIDAVVEQQIVANGDYVKVGDPLFRLAGTGSLDAHLPFPESLANKLKPGMKVRITSPTVPDKIFESSIKQIRPSIGETNRAIDVTVALDDPEGLTGGGTVNGTVVLATKGTAVMVPEAAVVLRPAGKVVYLLVPKKDESAAPAAPVAGAVKQDSPADKQGDAKVGDAKAGDAKGPAGAPPPRRPMDARQLVITTGVKQNGMVEVVSGLKGGELIAVDGSGFLTNGASVLVAPPQRPAGAPSPAKGEAKAAEVKAEPK